MIDPNCGIFSTLGLEKGIGGASKSNNGVILCPSISKILSYG